MPAVESQAISQVEYDASTRTLFIRFSSGQWYAYLDVAPAAFAAMTLAPSKGRFFQDEVRNRYTYLKLDLSPSRP